MSTLIFPVFQGQNLQVERSEAYNTTVNTTISGKEQRTAWSYYPIYTFDIKFNFVRQSALIPTPATYGAGVTYSAGDWTLYSATKYISLHNSNIGNTPSTSPTHWFASTGEAEIAVYFLESHYGSLDSFLYYDPYDDVQRRVRIVGDTLKLKRILAGLWECQIQLISVK